MQQSEHSVLQTILKSNSLRLDSAPKELQLLKSKTNFLLDLLVPVSEETERSIEAYFVGFEADLRKVIKAVTDYDREKLANFLKLPQLKRSPFFDHMDFERGQFLSRPDFFWSKDGFRMIEQNISSAVGGMSQVAKMIRFAKSLNRFQEGALRLRNPLQGVATYFASQGAQTVFALDVETRRGAYWDDTLIEVENAFSKCGVELIELFPELLRTHGEDLFCASTRVGHLLRLAVVSNVFDREVELSRLLSSRTVQWHGDLSEIVLWNKLWLPFFSDPSLCHEYGFELENDYSQWIPWSRLVREDVTQFEGRSMSLIDLLIKAKDRFVLKRGNGWLTRNVLFGVRYTPDGWLKVLKECQQDGDWMVQEFLDGISVEMKAEGRDVRCNLIVSPYMIEGKVAGYMVRTPGIYVSGEPGSMNGLTTAFTYRDANELL